MRKKWLILCVSPLLLVSLVLSSCNCNCSSNDGIGGDWKPWALGVKSGKITFVSDLSGNQEIYTMDADGSNQMNITNHTSDDFSPSWAPDGNKIAFVSNRDSENCEIYTMDGDGTNQTRLTKSPQLDLSPKWSPDGTKIAFYSANLGDMGIYVISNDGSGLTEIITLPYQNYPLSPSWSPDGSSLVFSTSLEPYPSDQTRICVINADGTNLTNLSNNIDGNDRYPSWYRYGEKIAFASDRDSNWEIYVMNADGSGQTNITNSPGDERYSVWGL